jgi:hypothetical protein
MVKTHVAYDIAVRRKYTGDLDFWGFHLDILRMFDQQLFQRILLLFLKKIQTIS